jgi:hypothetical protein
VKPSWDAAFVDASELSKFLRLAQHEFGCSELALRCDCENLETVYVVERSGELVVTDRGETFQYLDRSGDEAYSRIGVEAARMICHRHGAELDDRDVSAYPEVIQVLGDTPVQAVIEAVSAAVDELFETANEHRRET